MGNLFSRKRYNVLEEENNDMVTMVENERRRWRAKLDRIANAIAEGKRVPCEGILNRHGVERCMEMFETEREMIDHLNSPNFHTYDERRAADKFRHARNERHSRSTRPPPRKSPKAERDPYR